MTREEYYKRLQRVQNIIAMKGIPIDIITFTGFMSWEEKLRHLEKYENQYNVKKAE